MRGNGTSAAPIAARRPAWLLDVSRLVSRAGQGALTGIDRVELAYLDYLAGGDVPAFALSRTRAGYVLTGRAGMIALADAIRGRGWPRAGLADRVLRPRDPARAAAEALLRRHAIARCMAVGLGQMLCRHLPAGTACFNVGHANLTARTLRGLRAVPGAGINVLIHDTIPLDFPDHAREGVPQAFGARLARVSAQADLVIYNSADTRARAEWHMAHMGRVPPGLVVPLGVDVARPDPAALPAGLPPPGPYFVTLGTIEPRKNHALLLDLWQGLVDDPPLGGIPALVVIGRRGWRNAEVFARLDTAHAEGWPVIERADLDDRAVAALLSGAAALLQPSLAEGYGLPPLEAAALGTPVICADLAIYRETLGSYPVYLAPTDAYSWRNTILEFAGNGKNPENGRRAGPNVPTWRAHCKTVLSKAG
ncbi:glycosyl transferase family 1 [Rhodovulum bhavnagarense]|uniref:Glycosyl transferase family 1 n=1 Tax=Rhodovulum bhavnagarense TaxID=992286 RepID=A0A4R2RHR8_9RHOB|nr:glycosyltransferase [Rhodovulum bhavnagarense]TCP58725.1 glycosyl transferase family 1 [Rhodovulum bhavnagarense]